MISNTKDLIDRLECIFKNKNYSYEHTIYVDLNTQVAIECPVHGVFFETPYNLITNQIGCPKCYKNKSSGEIAVKNILDEYQIPYEMEKTMPYLKYKENLRFDFWIPDLKTAIEFNGAQHYMPIDFFGGEKKFKEQKIRDSIKDEFCKFYGFNLLNIKYSDNVLDKLKPLLNDYLESGDPYQDNQISDDFIEPQI